MSSDPRRHDSRHHRVAIVGGGLAGMAAAAALADAPLEVRVFEERRRTGGRAGSFHDAATGQTVDYCQHVAMGCCTNFLHLLAWSGLEGELRRVSEWPFLAADSPASGFRPSRWLPAPLHLAPMLGRLRFLSAAERRQIRRALWRLMRMPPVPGVAAGDAPTMGHWLRARGQSERVIRKFWNLVLASALGDHVDAVAVAPARKVFIDGFMRARGAADLLVPRQPLAHLFGERLPEVLRGRGISIETGVRVRSCDRDPAGGFCLQFDDAPPMVADDLILAIPWHRVPRILQGSSLADSIPGIADIGSIPGAPISGIHLWLDREITPLPQAVIVDRLAQWIFRPPQEASTAHSAQEAGEEGIYHQVVVSAAHGLRGGAPAEIVARVIDDLRAVFPPAKEARCLRWRIVTDPWAVYSISPRVDALRPSSRTAAAGFFLAGDWIQTGWPATMEGAVLSGYQAAEEVLTHHSLPATRVQPPQPAALLSRLLMR